MRLRFRLLLLMWVSLWQGRRQLLDEAVITFTVLPNDMDVSQMTNDRYVAVMDLGRIELGFRLGLLKPMLIHKWLPVAVFNTLRFRHPLRVFQRYQLKTRVVWWDAQYFYFQQTFVRHGRILATGYIKATLRDKQGIVPTQRVLEAIDIAIVHPEQPAMVAQLAAVEHLIHISQQE